MQEVQPHQPEAVAVQGHTVHPACLSPHITLDDLVASLRLEQGEVAAALVKARDSLKEQARIQQQHEAKQAAAAAALLAAEKAKPKAKHASCFALISLLSAVCGPVSKHVLMQVILFMQCNDMLSPVLHLLLQVILVHAMHCSE